MERYCRLWYGVLIWVRVRFLGYLRTRVVSKTPPFAIASAMVGNAWWVSVYFLEGVNAIHMFVDSGRGVVAYLFLSRRSSRVIDGMVVIVVCGLLLVESLVLWMELLVDVKMLWGCCEDAVSEEWSQCWNEDGHIYFDPSLCFRFAIELNRFVNRYESRYSSILIAFQAISFKLLLDWLFALPYMRLGPIDAFTSLPLSEIEPRCSDE